MTPISVLSSSETLTVLGSPPVVDVNVDIGPQGVRGSKVFAGIGEPATQLVGQTILLNDLYINASPGENYSYLYQYVSQPGGATWTKILKVSPAIYSSIQTTTFTSGNASITIPISQILTTTGTSPTASNFVIQHSIESADPIASSIEVPALVGAGTDLVINIHAAKRNGSSWSSLTGSIKVHLFISVK